MAFRRRVNVKFEELVFMTNCVAYRANAEACAKLAETVSDPHAKAVLLNMAEAWLRLADYVAHRDQAVNQK